MPNMPKPPLLPPGVPLGAYLLEQDEERLLLWRISEGAPDDDAFASLPLWPLLLLEPAA